jgi:hypothetical protein
VQLDFVWKLCKGLEHTIPIQVGVVLSKSSAEVAHVPLHLSQLVIRLFLKIRSVPSFVHFVQSLHNSWLQVVLAWVVDWQVEKHACHCFFINVFEVLQGHWQHLVVKATHVSEVDYDFPGL